ncbi:FK506-binding protein 5-like isoform X2 [Lytechinus pictus]|uniref:FK506-binding protein 5-like isoform X2 n=1 Tax=Lytechinus pictus TaxID=7653 RepID=UPI0030B9E8A4
MVISKMENNCGRCCEKASEVECADCGKHGHGGKSDAAAAGAIPLCLECSNLLHVGFMKDHKLETIEVKAKREDFKDYMKNYKKKEQVLKRSLVEIKHAYQNITSRGENNKYTVQQALVAINHALKKKEEALMSCMNQSISALKAQLATSEKDLEQRLKKLQSCHEKAEKVVSSEAEKFMSEHSEVAEEIEKLLDEKTPGDIPSLNPSISVDALDVSKVLESLESFGAEWLTNQKTDERTPLADSVKEIKEGDKLKGYVESRMDARGCFWVCQDMVEGITNLLDDLSFEIRKDIITHGWEDLTVQEGSLCVAQYYQDNRWYRARVEKLKEHTAEVRWLDYAHADEVQLSHIQPLRERFMDIPFQGLECSLFADMSEEMPRQARWEFSDLVSNMILDCIVIRKLSSANQGKVPLYLIRLDQTEGEKQDIAECVWNKAQDSRSSKGPIAYRDIRLLNKEAKDIQVVKEVVNSSKKTSDDAAKTTSEEIEGDKDEEGQKEDGEKEQDDKEKNEQLKEEEKKEEKPLESEYGPPMNDEKKEELKEEEKKADEREDEKPLEIEGEPPKVGKKEEEGQSKIEEIDKNKKEENTSEESLREEKESKPEEEDVKLLNGGDGETEGVKDEGLKDEEVKEEGKDGEEDLSLAQKLEKQGDTAPADGVPTGTHMSPMAFIAAHGSYTAINGISSNENTSNTMPPFVGPQPQLDTGWYQHYASHYAVTSMGLPAVVSASNGDAYGMVPGSHLGVHVATPLTADGTFWAAKVRGHEQEIRFRRLMHEISAPSDPLPKDQLHRGKMVCAFQHDMGHWCRAKVEEIAQDTVHVRLIDFGSVASLDCKQLKALDVRHGVFPFQAFECSLAKKDLTSFSESSRQLFHHLTAVKLITAKVDAVSDFVVYVSLFLTAEGGEVVDVVAELAKNESSRETQGKEEIAPSQQKGSMTNGQPKSTSKVSFSPFLKETYRKSPPFVADVERDFANLINSVNKESQHPTQNYTFPPMPRDQRAFVHELADLYCLPSDSAGQDAARHVVITATRGKSFVPSPTLSEVCQNEPVNPPGAYVEEQQSERDHGRYMGGNVRGDEGRQGCFVCGDIGHRKTNCPRNRNRERSKNASWWGGDSGRKGRKGGGGGRRN